MRNGTEFEEAKSQMRRGMLEFCTLLIISRGRAYSSDILSELKKADLIVVEGTLYPLLSRLKADGLLEYDWEESRAGPPRKYFRLTGRGEEKLEQLKATWQSLVESMAALSESINREKKHFKLAWPKRSS
ncbi:MAG: PadR family transcriptional regulator [SAR202 cluster bacterium]|nr:PadR family transcriptional regulator [SAR202 cluster bacterium]